MGAPRTEMNIWDMLAQAKMQADQAHQNAAMKQVMRPPIDERQTMLPYDDGSNGTALNLDQMKNMVADQARHGGFDGYMLRTHTLSPAMQIQAQQRAVANVKKAYEE